MKKIMFFGLILLMVLLYACAPATIPEAAPEPAAPAAEETPITVKEPVPIPEAAPEPTPAVPTTYLSNVVCDGDTIKATVTNLNDKAWVGIKTYLNGGWDKNPGCEKYDLAPGESTTCISIDFPVVYRNNKENILQIDANGDSELVRINCP